ncbi:MAG: O-antigen ligase family protein [Anaerolineaceae bacterium]|nr:O-antigen ligase family protein [Anaerolineaceae bacterium]
MIPPYLPLPETWRPLVFVIPFAFAIVMLFNNLEKLILAAIAIGVPLNLDFSLIVSPYAANYENIARGSRTLITITELRLSLLSIMVMIGYVLWLVRREQSERIPIRFYPATTIPALGFIFFSILSGVQALDKQLWFFRIAQLVDAFLVYFYLANHIRTKKDMWFFSLFLLCGLLMESVLIIIQSLTDMKTFIFAGVQVVSLGRWRVAGTMGNPGPAAGYLSGMVMIALAMGWYYQKSLKKLLIGCVFLSIIALICTGSRIGLVGFLVSIILFFLIGLHQGWIKKSTFLFLIVSIFLIIIVFFGVISSRFSTLTDSSTQSRPMMWRLAWRTIQAHPWLGVGAGNYALVTRDYFTADIGVPGEVYDKIVHNAYLGIWAESGTFSILCYIGLLGSAILKAWSYNRLKPNFVSFLGIGLALALASLSIQMVTGTFHTRPITYFVWILIALVACLSNLEEIQNPLQSGQLHLFDE